MTKKRPMTFRAYKTLHALGLIATESEEQLKEAPRPTELCGREIPTDLNGLTMGQLNDIMSLEEGNELEAVRIIAGIEPAQMDDEPATAAIGLLNFIQDELRRIADLFEQLKPHYTAEEREAGAEDLSFGIFGTIDWYALRMGIVNHDDVLEVPWIHIWQCSLIDKERHEYQQRLNEAYTNKSKKQ